MSDADRDRQVDRVTDHRDADLRDCSFAVLENRHRRLRGVDHDIRALARISARHNRHRDDALGLGTTLLGETRKFDFVDR